MAQQIKFYLDEHIPRVVANGLMQRGLEVIFAADADMLGKDDDTEHLPFATDQNATIVTCDRPFAGRTAQRTDHQGLICWTGKLDDFGGMINALSKFADTHSPEDVTGQVYWLK